MAFKDLRAWIAKIEEVGDLKRITAEVDWNLELSALGQRVVNQGGPALLFENIKGYQDTTCRKVLLDAF
jgi:4-hydroxy-3-polyprenylbenzoate decarboxylase